MKTIETQLECKATASLSEEVSKDLDQKDSSLASLLETNEQNGTNDTKQSN